MTRHRGTDYLWHELFWSWIEKRAASPNDPTAGEEALDENGRECAPAF